MGTGSSFPKNDEFDLSDEPGVVKRIPIEMNPRRTFGGALRSVGSLGRRPRGVSLRSTFSVELDNTEVEKIRKEFEMYKISKQAEMGDSLKKVNKLENENRRLRAELQALQKTCDKLRTQRDMTLDAEYQALERASSFETERNKVQKQFKIFRESKESEIRDLLKAKEKLERTLHHVDPEALSEMKGKDLSEEANKFQELWPSPQSEPSIGSSAQLQSLQRAFDAVEVEGIQTVSRAWTDLPSLSFAQTFNSFPFTSSTIRIYITVSADLSHDVSSSLKLTKESLRSICEKENRFLSIVSFTREAEEDQHLFMNMHEVRKNEIKRSNIFVALVSDADNFVKEDLHAGYLSNPGERKTVILFHDVSFESMTLSQQLKSSGLAVIVEEGARLEEKLNLLSLELETLVKQELGQDYPSDDYSVNRLEDSVDGMVTGALWDPYGEYEQHQAFLSALDCVCKSGMNKLHDRLNEHMLAAGPLPPLLILGGPGSGKSLLLAKWLSNHVNRNPSCLVLYHFVGSSSSRSAVVVNMVQRLTNKIMQFVPSSQNLTCDPSRLLNEFPHWLEKVSTKLPDGVVLVIDSADRFQNCEDDLSWLLDPLPVESRVIISAQTQTCPKVWRSWPALEIEPLSDEEVGEFMQMTCLKADSFLSEELERQILKSCQVAGDVHPLYVTILVSSLLFNLRWREEEKVRKCLNCSTSVQLYQFLIQDILGRCGQAAHLIKKVLQLILVSQNGISEAALFDLIPELSWNIWAPVYQELQNSYILTVRCGLLNFFYEQAMTAVQLMFSSEEEDVNGSRHELIDYYVTSLRSNKVTCHICDELPGLLCRTEDLPLMREFVGNVNVFRILYTRGRFADLLNCWQVIGLDRLSVSKEYFEIIKEMEEAASSNDTPCPEVADLFEMVGKFSKDLGLLNQAVWALQRALEIREAIDPDDPCVGRCFYLLGSLHIQWGKVATAESYFKQALSIWEMCCEGSCQQWVTRVLDSLAIIYKRQGKYNAVDSLSKKSAILKKEFATQESNSHSQRGQGNIKKRIQVLQEKCQKLEGISLAEALCDIGVLFVWQQDFDSAKEHLMQGITIMEKLHSVRTPKLLRPLGTLANVYEAEKDLEGAEAVYIRMLDICRKIPEKENPMANIAGRNLGALYRKQGKFDKAEMLYKDSIKRKEGSLGPDHPIVATDLLNLAVLYCQQENHTLALPLFERALSIYEDRYGYRHPRVGEILRNLAVLHYERGNEQQAAQLYKRANEIRDMTGLVGGSQLASRRSSVTSLSIGRTVSNK